jgi:hypothetical protein
MARSTVQNPDLSAAAALESQADTSRDTSSHLEGAVEPDAEPLVVLAETPSSSLSAEASVFIPRWARAATLLEAADGVQPVDSNTDDTVVSVGLTTSTQGNLWDGRTNGVASLAARTWLSSCWGQSMCSYSALSGRNHLQFT